MEVGQEFDCTYPLLVLGGSGYWKRWDIALGVGEHSLRSPGTVGVGSGVPGPAERLGPSGSQALEHPDAKEELRMQWWHEGWV